MSIQRTPKDPAAQTHPSALTQKRLCDGRTLTIGDEFPFLKSKQESSDKLRSTIPNFSQEAAQKQYDAKLAEFELATKEGRPFEGEIRSFPAIRADFNQRTQTIEGQLTTLALDCAPVIRAVHERFVIHAKREVVRMEAEERTEATDWGASNWFPSPKLVACCRLIKNLEARLANPGHVQWSDTPRKRLSGIVDFN